MPREHADLYLDTGPDARWPRSAARPGAQTRRASRSLHDDGRAASSRSGHLRGGRRGAARPPARHRSASSLCPAPATRRAGRGSRPPVLGGMRTPSPTDVCARRCAAARASSPTSTSRTGTGPDAEPPTIGDTAPKTATFTWNGFRGIPITITQTLPPMPPTYPRAPRRDRPRRGRRRGGRARPALAARRPHQGRDPQGHLRSAGVWPPPFYMLPEDVPFAYERAAAAVDFLVDTDRYAEGNNPTHGHELLASAATVAAQAVTAHRTHQPRPWPPR
jgi:hypothetical protein